MIRTVLADAESGRGLPLRAERWHLPAGASAPPFQAPSETMMYVIAGTGTLRTSDEVSGIEQESVIWLSTGDRIDLVAGPEGLDVLVGISE